jgi:endogenous inhibitor of DNA gyrase (YacG/DUF329 family)
MAEEEVRARCPRCGTQVPWKGNPYRPFCSQRCKLIDLGKWVDEEYRITAEKGSADEKEEGRGGES